MILNLNCDIDDNSLELLIEAYNTASKNEEKLDIYMCSVGGSLWIASAIIDIINLQKDITTLTVFGTMQSSALYIFLQAKCSKKIIPSTFAMVHQSSWESSIREGGGPKTIFDEFKIQHMKDYGKICLDIIKQLLLTDEETSKYKKGEEVYLNYTRLKKLFPEETKK